VPSGECIVRAGLAGREATCAWPVRVTSDAIEHA
jgi:hypothetical protein